MPARSRALREVVKVPVRREHHEIMSNAELRQQSVDCPDLDAAPTSSVSEFRGQDVIAPVGDDHWNGREALQQPVAILGPRDALENFLQHQSSGGQRLSSANGPDEFSDFSRRRWSIPAKRQRPDAGVHEEAHSRSRL